MSDDWKVGDLARCVFCAPGPQVDPWEPVVGECYHVVEVGPLEAGFANGTGLDFAEDPCAGAELMWDASWFRKIRPDKHEDCEPEFVEMLQRIKREVPA